MTLRTLTKPIFWAPWFAVAIISYFFVDRTLTSFAHNLDISHPWLISISSEISLLGNSAIYLIAGSLFFLWAILIAKNKQLAWMAAYLLLAVIVSGVICDVAKCLVGRARPSELFLHNQYGFYLWQFHNSFWSCPSGHSTTIAAVVTSCYLLFSRLFWPLLCVLVLVGVSRILVQAHYLSDVMTGAYLGFITAFWLHYLLALAGSFKAIPEPG